MSLITCPECGKQISDMAEVCPNCGISQKDILIMSDKNYIMLCPKCNRKTIGLGWYFQSRIKKLKNCSICNTPISEFIKTSITESQAIDISENHTDNYEEFIGNIVKTYLKNIDEKDKICNKFYQMAKIDKVSKKPIQEEKPAQQNIPKCPTCQSTNIQRISGLERGTSIGLFGLFSKKINKSFKCNNCGYTW